MTEHQDDNILDDDVEEHDFNFDNEKEDALLAETELDEFLEKATNEKRRISPIQGGIRSNSVITQDAEQLDQEDVLDIVIAEEDIVDTETVCLSNIHDIGIRVPECGLKVNEEMTEKNSVPFLGTNDSQNPKIEAEHESGDVKMAKNETLVTNSDDGCTTAGNTECSNEKKEIKDMGKSSVISLKTNIKKSYDDLPDLGAKVIELVQPSSSSRHRKHTKTFQHYFAKKKRSNDMLNVTRDDENFIENNNFKDVKYGSINETSHSNGRRDGAKNTKQSYHLSTKNNNEIYEEEIGHLQKVTSEDSFHGIVSEIRNFPMQPLLASKEIRDERSVLTTVQITEKRYQIASDFRIIRPSLRNPALNYVPENINYSRVNSFPMPKSGRPFHSATTLSTSNAHIASHSPASQFSNCNYHTNVENRSRQSILPVNFNNYCPPSVDVCPPPPVSFPQNCLPSVRVNQRMPQISSPLPLQLPPHPSQPLSNSFHHQQSHVFLPPYVPHHSFPANASFEGGNNDPASLTTSVNLHNLSSVDRLPYFPRHHHRSYSASHATPINPINTLQASFPNFRPPPPLIQMPPPQNFFANSQSINNQQSCTVARSVDYYAENNLLSFSPSSINMSTLCGPEASSQPPPPGVLTSLSPPSSVFSSGKVSVHSYVGNNRLEPTRFDKGVNFENDAFSQPNEKYPHGFNEQRRIHDEAIPNDRNLDIHPSKRIATTSVDTISNGNSRKHLRLNHSNIAQDQDDDDMEIYRKKVEQQKELREQFIQMKEEQRLKNQMQNFIQSNIKGILQKREQFLKKKGEENTFTSNSPVKDRENDHSIITDRKRNQCDRINKDRSNNVTMPTERKESHSLDAARSFSKDYKRKSFIRNSGTVANLKPESSNLCFGDFTNIETDTRQLHKVVKIKYKDGTVALKSFPVSDAANIKASFDEKSSFLNNLNVTIQDENVTASSANPRRMVVSKQISPRIEPKNEDKLSSRNENIIVESVRKGVTQSSVPLAQRFSNLKCNAPEKAQRIYLSSSTVKRIK